MITLDDRIASAFRDGVTSKAVVALIKEAEAASLASSEAAEKAKARALNPALSASAVAEARRTMEDSAFRRERLQAACWPASWPTSTPPSHVGSPNSWRGSPPTTQ